MWAVLFQTPRHLLPTVEAYSIVVWIAIGVGFVLHTVYSICRR